MSLQVSKTRPKEGVFFEKTERVVETRGFSDMKNITPEIQHSVQQAGLLEGLVAVFVPGSTAGLTTIEYEGGALQDLRDAIERMAPQSMDYKHNARWGDGNGFAHVRAALMGPSLSIPVSGGRLLLGTWQQALLIDFDNRPRKRRIIMTLMGVREASPT